MFDTLLESKRAKQANVGGTITSAVLHGLMIVGVVYATAKGAQEIAQDEEKALYVEVKPPEEPPPPDDAAPPPPENAPDTPPPPKGFLTLTAPIEIPKVIPQIDLTAKVTNELDFTAKGVQGGIAAGVKGGTGDVNPDQPFFQFEVERMASARPNQPKPNYPSILQSTRQEGRVMVGFVVDTAGMADMSTFRIIESTHSLFSEEVRRILPRYRFNPAEIGGRKVPVHVQMPFDFTLTGGNN